MYSPACYFFARSSSRNGATPSRASDSERYICIIAHVCVYVCMKFGESVMCATRGGSCMPLRGR